MAWRACNAMVKHTKINTWCWRTVQPAIELYDIHV